MMDSIEDRLQAALGFFLERAETAKRADDREMYEHLRRLAESVQEVVRQLDYLKTQVEEMRHAARIH